MKIRITDIFPTITEAKSPTSLAVDNSTSSSVATDHPKVSERPEPSQEREPGEDDAGIAGKWPPPAWSLADWVRGAKGDFHVFDGPLGVKPISRGFSWKD